MPERNSREIVSVRTAQPASCRSLAAVRPLTPAPMTRTGVCAWPPGHSGLPPARVHKRACKSTQQNPARHMTVGFEQFDGTHWHCFQAQSSTELPSLPPGQWQILSPPTCRAPHGIANSRGATSVESCSVRCRIALTPLSFSAIRVLNPAWTFQVAVACASCDIVPAVIACVLGYRCNTCKFKKLQLSELATQKNPSHFVCDLTMRYK